MRIHSNIVSWQRHHYNVGHRNPVNLLLHILSAPLFLAGLAGALVSLASLAFPLDLGIPHLPYWSAGAVFVPIVMQGIGHSQEKERPIAFLSPLDFLARFFVENTITFWRFIFSGDFFRNLKS